MGGVCGDSGWRVEGDEWGRGRGRLPELTVMASWNCSLQLLVPTTSARLVFFRILSTALWEMKDTMILS